jgi:hypothetical protein
MSKFQKLAAINKIANDCIQDGDYELASKFHQEFLKIAQVPGDDSGAISRSRVAKGMGYSPDTNDNELLANVIRICDYIKPERLKDPSKPASPNNVMLRSMAGATPENSYADEYYTNCSISFNSINSPTMTSNFKNKCDYIRKAARAGDMNAVVAQFTGA